jgi:hypothetical protein
MQVFALPLASRTISPLGAVGRAVHQQAAALVVSTMPQEKVAPHCEQLLISIPFSFRSIASRQMARGGRDGCYRRVKGLHLRWFCRLGKTGTEYSWHFRQRAKK